MSASRGRLHYPSLQWGRVLLAMALMCAVGGVAGAANDKVSPRVRTWARQAKLAADEQPATMHVMLEVEPHPEARAAVAPASPKAIAAGQQDVEQLLEGPGFRPLARLSSIPWIVAEISPEMLTRLEILPEVRRVCASLGVHGDLGQSVRVIGADRVHRYYHYEGTGAVVGMIDSGIDLDHPDLVGSVLAGWSFLDDSTTSSSNVQDDHGHGTHVAGVITSAGVSAPKGVAPAAQLVVIRALKKETDGSLGGYLSDVIRGMDWLIANHSQFPTLRYINLSIATSLPGSQCPCDTADEDFAPLVAAIDRLNTAGMICIVSAGNGGPNTMTAPGCFSQVVSVGSTYDNAFLRAPASGTYDQLAGGFPACFDSAPTTDTMTCFGSRLACLDLLAPGYLITSSLLDGTRLNSFGTSQATAHVTGALALLQGLGGGWGTMDLVDVLKETGKQVVDPTNAARKFRRIDVYAAMKVVRGSDAHNWTSYD